jgi:hypothetical protein
MSLVAWTARQVMACTCAFTVWRQARLRLSPAQHHHTPIRYHALKNDNTEKRFSQNRFNWLKVVPVG